MSAATLPTQFEFVLPETLGLVPGGETWIPFGASRVRLVAAAAAHDGARPETDGTALAPLPESVAVEADGERI